MIAIDIRYAEYELGFFDANRYANFGATTTVLGLTGVASVSSGGAAQILSALAAGVTGVREAYNHDVLIEKTAVALETAMRSQRNLIAARIRAGLQKPATAYSFGAALSDLFEYFRAGTIVGAIIGVNDAVSADERNTKEELSAIAATPSARNLRQRYRALPRADQPAFVRRVEDIMRQLQISGTALELINDPDPARDADRERVLRALGQ